MFRQWNGYRAETYKAAWTRIVTRIRAHPELEHVAFVWDFSCDASDLDYRKFYPGDSVVDWWGVNIFGSGTKGGFATED